MLLFLGNHGNTVKHRCGWMQPARYYTPTLSARAVWRLWEVTTNTITTATSTKPWFWRFLLTLSFPSSMLHVCAFLHSRDTFVLCLLNSSTSLVAGFAIFSVLGFMSYELGIDISEVAESGRTFSDILDNLIFSDRCLCKDKNEITNMFVTVHCYSYFCFPNFPDLFEDIFISCKITF